MGETKMHRLMDRFDLLLFLKSQSKLSLGRSGLRWEDNIN
jgi:hypothetical protein